jgi:hypothetical protein
MEYFPLIKELVTGKCNNMNESQNHYAEGKKPNKRKECIGYDSTHTKL